MLLLELTGVKRFHKYTEYDLEKLMRRLGIRFVGGGKYGKVFTHPKWNYVVKIFNDPYYLSFVDFVLKNPNPHYPKIIKKPLRMHLFHSRFRQDQHEATLVKIERLQEITDRGLLKFIVENLENGMVAWHHKHFLKDKGDQSVLHYKSKNYYKTGVDGQPTQDTWAELFEKHPWFESLCGAYHALTQSEEVQGSPDIHSGNFMQRQDGTIVIIDPTWEGSNPEKDYYEALRRETDSGYDYYDGPDTKGPRYKWMDRKEREAREQQRLAQKVAHDFDISADIPF